MRRYLLALRRSYITYTTAQYSHRAQASEYNPFRYLSCCGDQYDTLLDCMLSLRTVMCTLLKLPEAIQVAVLVDWLPLWSIPSLDSAFCNAQLRHLFLRIAFDPFTTYTTNLARLSVNYKEFTSWLLRKNAYIDGMIIGHSIATDHKLRQQILGHQGQRWKWVVVRKGSRPVLSDIAYWCSNMRRIVVVQGNTRCLRSELLWDKQLLALAKRCRSLESLSLHYAPLSSTGLVKALSNCKQLMHLTLVCVGCEILPEVAIPSLMYLDVSRALVSDEVMAAIGKNCPSLRTLHVFAFNSRQEHSSVTDVGVEAVLAGCPLLQATDVEQAEIISDHLRVDLAARRQLIELVPWLWPGMTEQEVLKVSPILTTLRCLGCPYVTNQTLAVCARHCPLLKEADLSECVGVTLDGVLQLARRGNRLRSLVLPKSMQQDDVAVALVVERCALLTSLNAQQVSRLVR